MHEIKKKEAEVLKVRQQMKKNVLSKSNQPTANKNDTPINSNNPTVKNSFQVIERL